MPKIRVIKHGGFKYGVGADRRQYGLGKELLVKQKDARMLVAAKLAEVVEDAPVKAAAPKPRARTTAARTTAGGTRKGTYNRRDMKAK